MHFYMPTIIGYRPPRHMANTWPRCKDCSKKSLVKHAYYTNFVHGLPLMFLFCGIIQLWNNYNWNATLNTINKKSIDTLDIWYTWLSRSKLHLHSIANTGIRTVSLGISLAFSLKDKHYICLYFISLICGIYNIGYTI